MKVKIKDLHPNPFRDIASYQLDEQKVLSLEQSINQTGFWDNLLAREYNGEIQIAYGHHRLEALKRLYGPEFEVDIPVKDLDDATMLRIMANENMEDWNPTPAVINHTVKKTREFLLKHPEIAAKYSQLKKSSQTGENMTGADLIARFLNWKPTRVSEALEHMNLINNGEATQQVFEWFNTQGSARTFIDAIKEQKKIGAPIPVEKQPEIAKKFRESGNSKKVLKETVREVTHKHSKETKPLNENIKAIENEVNELSYKIDGLCEGLDSIQSLYRRIGGIPEQWEGMNWHIHLVDKLHKIMMKMNDFIKEFKKQPAVR